MIQQSHCDIVLVDTNVVFSNFDKDRSSKVMIVSKCGFEVQKCFVMVVETVFERTLVKGHVSERMVEST